MTRSVFFYSKEKPSSVTVIDQLLQNSSLQLATIWNGTILTFYQEEN